MTRREAASEAGVIPPVFCSLAEIVLTHAGMRPGAPAFSDGAGTVSWAQFAGRASRLAAALEKTGTRPGDKVALLTGNAIWAYEALMAILMAGAVPALLPPLLPPPALARLCADSRARILLSSAPAEPLARACLDADRTLSTALLVEGQGLGGESVRRAAIEVHPDDACSIIYSSGTTGTPKGIVHSHRARLWMASSLAAAFGVTSTSKILVSTPPFTNGTWILLLPALLAGATVCICEKFNPAEVLDLIGKQAITHTFMVPTQYAGLVAEPSWPDARLGSLTMALTAGAPMPDALRKAVRGRLGEVLSELWGLTEGVAVIAGPEDMEARPGSVGRASGGVDLVILGPDGAPLAPGEVGEISGRSQALMSGYLNQPDLTSDIVWRDGAGRTFIRTGDLGMLDPDGFLYLRGRAKDVIISGGMNIYPTDLEAVMVAMPEIADAAVIAMPHEKWGETPVGFIIPAAGAEISTEALLGQINAGLGRHQKLAALHVQAGDFPRNALGKVLKGALREGLEAATQKGWT